jgi:hypothetical protein
MKNPPVFGLLAEFVTAEALIEATHQAQQVGYRKMDAYTPFPIEEVGHALGARGTRLPWIVLAGGLVGLVGGFMLQVVTTYMYPMNVGGRPLFSWASFIPGTFETTVLLAAFSAVLGMLALNGLPELYHPVFGVPGFEKASHDRFFLQIEAKDPKFDLEETRRFLESFQPEKVTEIERYKYQG